MKRSKINSTNRNTAISRTILSWFKTGKRSFVKIINQYWLDVVDADWFSGFDQHL